MELIHTCYRITEPERSVAFYKALEFEERRRMPIRDEAINIFMGLPGDGDRLELTYNLRRRLLRARHGLRPHRDHGRRLDGTLERLDEQGIAPEKPPYTVREGGSHLCFVRDPDRNFTILNRRTIADEARVARSQIRAWSLSLLGHHF